MTTIRELVLAYAGMWAISRASDPEKKYQAEAERIMQQIESYYVPRPPGSVLSTQDEHDTLTAIASFVDQWKPYLYEGGVPLTALNELDGLLQKWRESLPQE